MPDDHAREAPRAQIDPERGASWTRRIDHSQWVPLPNFQIRVELGRPDELLRPFIKLVFRVVAVGVAATFSGKSEEVQLVMLCKCWTEATTVVFQGYIPNFATTQFVLDHLPTRRSIEDLESVLQRVKVDVQHSYKCPLNTLFPMVIVYRPASSLVLLANENHFADAEQFLSPHLCHTTSGFLNFLGAFSLAAEGTGRKILIREKEGLEEAGLTEWLRWLYEVSGNGTWETRRILVNTSNAEEYVYDYDAANK